MHSNAFPINGFIGCLFNLSLLILLATEKGTQSHSLRVGLEIETTLHLLPLSHQLRWLSITTHHHHHHHPPSFNGMLSLLALLKGLNG